MSKTEADKLIFEMREECDRLIDNDKIVGRRLDIPRPDGTMGYALCYGPDSTEKLPTVINVHGGGFVCYYPEFDDVLCSALLDEFDGNLRIFSVNYRLAPEFQYPQDKQDVYDEICWLYDNANALGIDVDKVGITGHSAGANIATVVCMMAKVNKGPKFACQVLNCPVCDMKTPAAQKPQPEGAIPVEISDLFDAAYRQVERSGEIYCSPILATENDLEDLPPAVLLAAEYDALCDEAFLYANHLKDANVETTISCFSEVGHVFSTESYEPPESRYNDIQRKAGVKFMAQGLKRYLNR